MYRLCNFSYILHQLDRNRISVLGPLLSLLTILQIRYYVVCVLSNPAIESKTNHITLIHTTAFTCKMFHFIYYEDLIILCHMCLLQLGKNSGMLISPYSVTGYSSFNFLISKLCNLSNISDFHITCVTIINYCIFICIFIKFSRINNNTTWVPNNNTFGSSCF